MGSVGGKKEKKEAGLQCEISSSDGGCDDVMLMLPDRCQSVRPHAHSPDEAGRLSF